LKIKNKIMAVKPIPEGYHTVTPFIVVKDAKRLIEFLKQAFDAETKHVSEHGGVVMHAEVLIGNSIIMLAEGSDKFPPVTANHYLYVPDTDVVYDKAIKAGGESIMAPADQFYGDRNAGVKDFAGNQWWIATHVEDVSPEEIQKRMMEANKKKS
jgi:uncharacterized glyoxalase superfamily protein PhnB